MRRDEELALEARENPEFQPVLRLYSWKPYAISLGYQQHDDEIDLDVVRANGIDVVRRPTGGRAVYHSDELTYAVIQRFEPSQGVYAVHNAIIEMLVEALTPITGDKLRLTSPQAGARTREVYKEGLATNIACFASTSRHEVTFEGRKVIGSAQRRFGNAVLQHGSILLGDEHLRLPEFLKIDAEQKLAMRSLLEKETATLSEICGKKLTAEVVADVIMNPSRADFQSAHFQSAHIQTSSQSSSQIQFSPNSKLPQITDELHISHRNLPHWQQGGSVYFITFRSLRGELPDAAREIVKQRILLGHDKYYQLYFGVVMHDHVHIMLQPKREPDGTWIHLSKIIRGIKGTSDIEINKLLSTTGSVWQREQFDRIVRNDKEFNQKWGYMLMNPVKAGLVNEPDDYKYYCRPGYE